MKTITQRLATCARRLAFVGLSSITLSAVAAVPLAATATADILTDKLLANVLERHVPAPLYQKGNNSWPGGSYKLEVFKAGKPRVTSGAASVHLQMPLKIAIVGNASNDLLQLKLACNTSFTTLGEVEFTPRTPGTATALNSKLTLPIPAVMANCDGMQLPIESYLRTLVEQNKKQWEVQIDEKVNAWLAE